MKRPRIQKQSAELVYTVNRDIPPRGLVQKVNNPKSSAAYKKAAALFI